MFEFWVGVFVVEFILKLKVVDFDKFIVVNVKLFVFMVVCWMLVVSVEMFRVRFVEMVFVVLMLFWIMILNGMVFLIEYVCCFLKVDWGWVVFVLLLKF